MTAATLDDLDAQDAEREQWNGIYSAPTSPTSANDTGILLPPEIFAPLPPLPYTIAALGIAPGAPTLWSGYGFSMKTLSAQSLALSIASGKPVWGVYNVTRGRVLHIDYEQGERLTRERYQRLARALGIDPRELEPSWLSVVPLPQFYLDAPGATDRLARLMQGCALVLVDSLRAAAPSLEENSSAFRTVLDAMTRASEKTGAAPLVVHHNKKPREDDTGGAKMSVRGSSAIFDACASVFVLGAVKGQPVRVQHEKDRNRGTLMPDFGLQAEDVELGGDGRAGLRVVHLEPEQLTSAKSVKEADRTAKAHAGLADAAVAAARAIHAEPGIVTRNLIAAVKAVLGSCSPGRLYAARRLLGKGVRVESGERGAEHHHLEPSHLPPDLLERLGPL
jgi:hypothetical protein